MKLFWVDEKRGLKKNYTDLVTDLSAKRSIKRHIYLQDPYEIFLELLHSLLLGCEIELLDSDFSKTEIENLNVPYEAITTSANVRQLALKDYRDLKARMQEGRSAWRLAMYTSGTTGRPKKVLHSMDTLTRGLKTGEKYHDSVWAFAYNPTHFAGLQVFFQALFNQNTMVYIFDQGAEAIRETLLKYKITNVSATPTFYRNMIPHIDEGIMGVQKITVGGEKFDPLLMKQLKRVFPNTTIRNVYASTEAGSLFGAEGEIFSIRQNHKGLIKISKANELLVHRNLLGASTEYELEDDWYHTGDIVEVVAEDKFRFVTRKTEMINVGGYKINPHEPEEEIRKIDGIVDVRVRARANKVTGNLLVADIVKDDNYTEEEIEQKISAELSKTLRSWKIPRVMYFSNVIEKTRTGKKVRR